MTEDKPPFHLVSLRNKHLGPFSTYLDAALALSIGTDDWASAAIMDRKAFKKHVQGTLECDR